MLLTNSEMINHFSAFMFILQEKYESYNRYIVSKSSFCIIFCSTFVHVCDHLFTFISICVLSVLCARCIRLRPLCCYVPICLPVYSVMRYTVRACSVNQWLKVTGRAYSVSRESNKWDRGFPSPRLLHPASFTLTVIPRVSRKRQC